jgi:histidyl-tRNA synthetase
LKTNWKEKVLYQAPRGTQDILPEDQPYWAFLHRKAAEICHLYGYRRIDTPAFEETGLFKRSVGEQTDIVQKEMYTFDDRGGNSMTLRPEGTAPVCRAYLEHGMSSLSQPVKLYYLGPLFRYERPQAGRYREFHQLGCEAIGEIDPALDAEVIDTAWQFFLSLGIRNLNLNINSIGCKKCRPAYLEKLRAYYAGCQPDLCPDCRTRLDRNALRLLDCKTNSCQAIAVSAPKSSENLCQECADHFEKLKKYLTLLDLPFRMNHCLVRGLDYYTKTVFEIQPEIEGSQSTIGGGGRYDDLIEELGGKPVPAIGFATGLERIVANLKRQGIPVPLTPGAQVYVTYVGEAAKDRATALAAAIRRTGTGAIASAGGKSLKAQLRQANSLAVRYTVILGEEEIKAGTVILKDMSTSQQQTLPESQLMQAVKMTS